MKKLVTIGLLATVCLLTAMAQRDAKPNGTIRRNQVGCYPQQEKVIVVEGEDPTGKIRITTPDGKTMKPTATVRKAVSPLSQKTRYVVDLGNLSATGRYRLSVGGDTCSLIVADRPFQDLAKASLRLFYLIRSGIPIEQGGIYNRPLGHPDTCVLVHNSAASAMRPTGTVISSPYGWYDAGDYNKYVVNSAFSIGLMFAAYEQQREYFDRLQTDIPESANATPDFLDEMMFNLRWLLTMQDPSDGGVYHKVTTPNFESFIMPTACRQTRYVVAKSVTATLDFAAVMADAARLFNDWQKDYPGFAAQAAVTAERAYQWAKDNPTALYRQQQLKEPAVTTGTYGDWNTRDELFWAASALYRLTGKQTYLEDARQYQPKQFTTPSWGNVASLGAFEWLSANDSELGQAMLQQLTDYCEEQVKDVDSSSFQSPYGNSARDFGWGCLAEKCCCQALAMLYADKMTDTEKYRRYALQNADYLLGRNATGYCYVTGFGDRSPMHPHHRISASDNIEAPFTGMLVGGSNPGQQDKKEIHHAVYPSNIPDESYLDDTESYASNEVAINWNASLVAFIGWLDALAYNSSLFNFQSSIFNLQFSLRNGELWPDDKGQHINAHGGGILKHGDTYYWFGEHKSERTSDALVGVMCYASKDLVNWRNCGVALSVTDEPGHDIERGCILERPKVIYNPVTKKFCMWFHLELKGQGYNAARYGVAVADHPEGPYQFLYSSRADADTWPVEGSPMDFDEYLKRDFAGGQMSRDMTLYVDDDGKAYHIFSSEENYTLHIAELTDDYLHHSGRYTRVAPGGHNEAPAIFKHEGTYWMITSGCTGWAPNEARMFSAPSIWGPWTQHPNPCRGPKAEITFGGQSTFILEIENSKSSNSKSTWVFMADIWRPRHPIDARYIWLPIEFEDGKPVVRWQDQWSPKQLFKDRF